MALWILQPDADGNCCDCTGRTEPCDSCGGGCGSCTYECISVSDIVVSRDPCVIDRGVVGTDCTAFDTETDIGGACGVVHLQGTAQVRLVISGLTPDIETHAFVYFSDGANHEFIFTPTSDTYTTEYVDVPSPRLNNPDISVTGCSVVCPCQCALLIPPLSSPYADYATASSAISDYVAGCLSFYDSTSPAVSFSVDTSVANQLGISAQSLDGTIIVWASLTVGEATTITIPYSFTHAATSEQNTIATLYSCGDGSVVDTDSNTSPTGTLSLSIPALGTYYVKFSRSIVVLPSDISGTLTLELPVTTVFNPVIAQWDDSGTTRPLEACPKMLIPLSTASEDWYGNQSVAQNAIDNATAGCICFIEVVSGPLYTAIDSGTSITLTQDTGLRRNNDHMWISINCVEGATITATFSTNGSGGSTNSGFGVYDYDGVLIDTAIGSSSATSAPVPYTGRYILSIVLTALPPADPFTIGTTVITSSSTMSANPIQALYDVGLDCPARLDCT